MGDIIAEYEDNGEGTEGEEVMLELTIEPPTEEILIRTICTPNVVLKNYNSQRRHYAKYHDTAKNKFNCPECGKSFLHKSRMEIHARTHLPKSQRPTIKCTLCKATFLYTTTLRIHYASAHPEYVEQPEELHDCPVCGRQFNRLSAMVNHQKSHGWSKCKICFLAFKNNTELD